MGFLRQGGNKPGYIPKYTGLQIQTSSNSVPITILYGTNRIAPNVIWTGGFFAIPQYQKQGGKGGGGGGLQGYTYYTSFAMGLCEGPINNYGEMWIGQKFLWSLYGSGLSQATGGSTPQPAWGWLQAYWPGQDLQYNGLAYVGGAAYNLGSSPTLPQFSFEIHGITGAGNSIWNGNVINGKDSDPALIIQDFLTNAQYGVGFPAAGIDATTLLGSSGDSSYQTYCRASGLAISPALVNAEKANSILARWLNLTNTAAVWSGGKLKFIPYGDTQITGATSIGNVTFVPNVTPIYNLGDDDFIHEDGADPLEVERSDPYSSYNWQRLQYSERYNSYDATPIEVFDQNAIELYGLRRESDIMATEICEKGIAQISAQLILQRQLYIRNAYKFKLSFEYCLLEPMDLVTVTDAGLGLNNVAVRITSIEEDADGLLAVIAEEFPGGTATAVQYPIQTKKSNSTDQGVVPARVNAPVIYEPPASLTGGVAQVWAAVSGGVATAYKLSEGTSTGNHYTSQALTDTLLNGDTVVVSIYAQAKERTKFCLQLWDGSANRYCAFDLTSVTSTPGGPGVVTSSIIDAGPGEFNKWYLCTCTFKMTATAAPVFYVLLNNASGATSYTGVSGNGVYIWGAEFAWSRGGAAPVVQNRTFLPPFTALTGTTLSVNGTATPEGVAGIGDLNWGGAFVWLSADNATFGQIGTVNAPSRQGFLTATLATPPGLNPDITNTLFIDLAESRGQLSNATNLDAQNGVTLCLVDNELLAYGSAAFVSGYAYNLTYLYRGLYGTTPAAHSSSAPFVRVDDAIFKYNLPAAYVGVTLYMKFQSFNIFGQAVEDLSECTVYTYTPNGQGQALGPVAQAMSLGTSLDYGLASAGVTESDDFGLASTVSNAIIDMGWVSA